VVIAIIDFSPLWDTMKEKQVSQYQLLKQGIDNKTLDSIKKNRNITLNTLEKLCQILNCEDLNKIVKFID
jgi:DNA-binding Xre family transcriptional regulator